MAFLEEKSKMNEKIALDKARKNRFVVEKHDRYACTTRSRLHGLQFHLGTEFVYSLHDTSNVTPERQSVLFGMKTEMKAFRN